MNSLKLYQSFVGYQCNVGRAQKKMIVVVQKNEFSSVSLKKLI